MQLRIAGNEVAFQFRTLNTATFGYKQLTLAANASRPATAIPATPPAAVRATCDTAAIGAARFAAKTFLAACEAGFACPAIPAAAVGAALLPITLQLAMALPFKARPTFKLAAGNTVVDVCDYTTLDRVTRVGRALVAVAAIQRRACYTLAANANVRDCTLVPILAVEFIRDKLTSGIRCARVVRADIGIITWNRLSRRTDASLATVAAGAQVTILAIAAVCHRNATFAVFGIAHIFGAGIAVVLANDGGSRQALAALARSAAVANVDVAAWDAIISRDTALLQ